MDNTLKIAIIPLDITYGDKTANLEAVERILSDVERDTDIVVLPELFSTAFIPDADTVRAIAEPADGPTIRRVHQWAKSRNCAIAGSYYGNDADGRCFNRGFFIEPSGDEMFYDKRHLFSLSKEARYLTHGASRPPMARFRGWNIAMIICYDLRFPVWSRNGKPAYDIMLVPANWPTARGYAWTQLLFARAIENQSYYVGADRSGTDDFGSYDGLSTIVDFMGAPVGRTDPATGIVYATADRQALERARRRMPAADDADRFSVSL